MENEKNSSYGRWYDEMTSYMLIPTMMFGALAVILYPDIKDYRNKISSETMQINRVEDKDNVKGYDTIILEDGREVQIQDRNGKLNLLEKSLERIK